MKKREIFRLLMLICCIALPFIALAQGPPDPNDTPIDGGLSVLLAAGVGYGVKRYRDAKKKKAEEESDMNLK
jgi:hypothetical protein